jgi:DNA-binding XRE family transcriptional regulator
MTFIDLRITPRGESSKVEMLTAHAGKCIQCPKLSVSDLDPTRPLRSDEWLVQERRSIGDRIRVRRIHENLTQVDVAAASCVARKTYQDVEAGLVDARISTLLRIAHVLGVHVADLLHG